jgi:hypothetical protein
MRASTRILCGSLIALAASTALAQRPFYLLPGVHPAYSAVSMRPASMATSGANAAPNTGGMAFLPDGRLFIASMNSTNGGAEANRRGISHGYLFSGIPTATSNAQVTVDSISTGYQMPSGAVTVGDTIYTLDNENGITRLTKNGSAWTKTTIYNGALGRTPGVLSDTVNRTWTGGMVYRNGFLYAAVGTGLIPGGTSYGFTTAQEARLYRGKGAIWKVSLNGAVADTFAGGVRNPVSMGWGPDSQMFYTDNQGSFEPASAMFPVFQGAFFGHPKTPFDNKLRTPPAIIFPYGSNPGGGDSNNPVLARVATDMLTLRDGVYKNQMLVGTSHSTGINRVFLEMIPTGVPGQYVYQGAIMPFSQGFGVGTGTGTLNVPTGSLPGVLSDFRSNVNRMAYGPDGRIYLGGGNSPGGNSQGAHGFQDGLQYGLARLASNGDTVFEIKAVRSLSSTQMEVEFTEPVVSISTSNVWVRQWGSLQGGTGNNNSYGGGYQDGAANLTVSAVTLNGDKTRATLTITGLSQRPTVTTAGSAEDRRWGYLVQIRIRGIAAVSGRAMWTDTSSIKRGLTAWYTMNKFGPGIDAGGGVTAISRGDARGARTGLVFSVSGDGIVVRHPVDGAWTLRTLDTRGRVLATHAVGAGQLEYKVPASSLSSGVTVLEAKSADGRRFTASVAKP